MSPRSTLREYSEHPTGPRGCARLAGGATSTVREYSEYPMSVLGVPRVSTQSSPTQAPLWRRRLSGTRRSRCAAAPARHWPGKCTGTGPALACTPRRAVAPVLRSAHQTAAGVPGLFVRLFARVVDCASFPRAARHAHRGALDTHPAVLRALPRRYSEYSHARGGTLSTHTDAAVL